MSFLTSAKIKVKILSVLTAVSVVALGGAAYMGREFQTSDTVYTRFVNADAVALRQIARADRNFAVLDAFAERTPWIANLAAKPETRSNTSVCFTIADPEVTGLPADAQAAFAKAMVAALEKEGVAFDIGSYRDAPSGLRIWAGATVETSDLEALTHWLDWAFATQKAALKAAAA